MADKIGKKAQNGRLPAVNQDLYFRGTNRGPLSALPCEGRRSTNQLVEEPVMKKLFLALGIVSLMAVGCGQSAAQKAQAQAMQDAAQKMNDATEKATEKAEEVRREATEAANTAAAAIHDATKDAVHAAKDAAEAAKSATHAKE
jgi:hypothetical protein